MRLLVIGKNSFLAQSLKKDDHITFLSHQEALIRSNWAVDSFDSCLNLACDSCIYEGRYSDFDYKTASIAQDQGIPYIMLSSRAVYGTQKAANFPEDTPPLEPISPYGRVKKQIEDELLKNFEKVTIVRPSNVFGHEYQPHANRNTFTACMLKSLKEEGVIRFNLPQETIKDFLPAPIFADHIVKIAENPKAGIYNLGAGVGVSIHDVAQSVIEGYGSGSIKYDDSTPHENFILNMKKTNEAFDLKEIKMLEVLSYFKEIGTILRE